MATAISGQQGGREGVGETDASGDRAAGEQAHRVGRPREQLSFMPPLSFEAPGFQSTILRGERQQGPRRQQHPFLTCPSFPSLSWKGARMVAGP